LAVSSWLLAVGYWLTANKANSQQSQQSQYIKEIK